jgi:2-methylisocitrate lyase-like PEP mutase family enzyme
MGMYIDTAYPDVTQDARLASILTKMKALAVQIEDAEWQGQDVTAMRQQLSSLKARHNDGATYEPLF